MHLEFSPDIAEVPEVLALHSKKLALMQGRCKINAWWRGCNDGLFFSGGSEIDAGGDVGFEGSVFSSL